MKDSGLHWICHSEPLDARNNLGGNEGEESLGCEYSRNKVSTHVKALEIPHSVRDDN